MTSLRDRLNAYGAQKKVQRPTTVQQKEDCYRVLDKTPRSDYPLPDTVNGASLEALLGETFSDIPIDKMLFLDTETTGLSGGVGTLAFLVGLGYFEDGAFVVEQDLMRDYDEEIFLLNHVRERLQKAQLLVTFNGHTFDMPLLNSRFLMQRMRPAPLPPHVDLLRSARSVWRLRLKHCSLSALEEAVFHQPRKDDLPGALVPKQFFDYLKCRDFALLEPVLQHNCQDIKTLPHLLHKLLSLYENPLASPHAQDVFSIGRVMEKRGQKALARKCYRAADKGTMSRLSRMTLADSYRREREFALAASIYEEMIADGLGGAFPYIALAKLCEHKLNDPARALQLTKKAILLTNPYDDAALQAAQKRALRLMKKLEGRKNNGIL